MNKNAEQSNNEVRCSMRNYKNAKELNPSNIIRVIGIYLLPSQTVPLLCLLPSSSSVSRDSRHMKHMLPVWNKTSRSWTRQSPPWRRHCINQSYRKGERLPCTQWEWINWNGSGEISRDMLYASDSHHRTVFLAICINEGELFTPTTCFLVQW